MKPIIEIAHLSKRFGDLEAVRDLSFTVREGELFAFLGVNGAGKSTTISILCGRLRQDAGEVRIGGRQLEREGAAIKARLGVVFQNSALDKALTVLDNLRSRAALYGISGRGLKRRVAELAHAFGMKVIAASARKSAAELSASSAPVSFPVEFVEMDELFRASDVLSLHCPLTDQTRAIVNAANIVSMKDGAILLNLARGPLLDEAAVAEALASGKLGGLGADVVSVEPIAQDNPLLASPNTLLTPHIAWATRTARQNITRIIAENIAGWMAGQPKSVVNKAYLNG